MSIFVLLLYSGYAVGKVGVRFRSSMIPQTWKYATSTATTIRPSRLLTSAVPAAQDASDHEDPDRAHSSQPRPPPAPDALLAAGGGHQPVDPEDDPGITDGERKRVHATSPASPPATAGRTSITVCPVPVAVIGSRDDLGLIWALHPPAHERRRAGRDRG